MNEPNKPDHKPTARRLRDKNNELQKPNLQRVLCDISTFQQKPGRSVVNPYECLKCGGLGVIINAENVASPCSCGAWEKDQTLERLKAARIPKRFDKKTLDSFLSQGPNRVREELKQNAKSYAKTFSREEDRGIVLHGGTGAGKTHLAVGILKEIINRGYTGVYYNVTELLNDLRSSYSKESDLTEQTLLERIHAADIVVFDDVGAEAPSNWVLDRLYLMFNRRYENAKPVIITTNCTRGELKERVGERITSRLYEMCFPLGKFPEEDYRYTNMQ
ncbi:MAG: ATP-binding protein [Sumerlaeia bacterium]